MAINLKFLDRFAGRDAAFAPYIKPKVSKRPSRYKTPEEEEEEEEDLSFLDGFREEEEEDLSFLDKFKEEEKEVPKREEKKEQKKEEQEEEEDLSFLDKFATDPIEDYNAAASISKKLADSQKNNYARYRELFEKPEKNEEEQEEMRSAWQKSHDAELSAYEERKRLEALRPEVEKIVKKQEREEIASIEKLKEDPNFVTAATELLKKRNERVLLQQEIDLAIEEPDEREKALKDLREEYSSNVKKIIEGVNENVSKKQKKLEEVVDVLKYSDEERQKERERMASAAARGGVIPMFVESVVEPKLEERIEKVLQDVPEEEQDQYKEEARTLIGLANGNIPYGIVNGRLQIAPAMLFDEKAVETALKDAPATEAQKNALKKTLPILQEKMADAEMPVLSNYDKFNEFIEENELQGASNFEKVSAFKNKDISWLGKANEQVKIGIAQAHQDMIGQIQATVGAGLYAYEKSGLATDPKKVQDLTQAFAAAAGDQQQKVEDLQLLSESVGGPKLLAEIANTGYQMAPILLSSFGVGLAARTAGLPLKAASNLGFTTAIGTAGAQSFSRVYNRATEEIKDRLIEESIKVAERDLVDSGVDPEEAEELAQSKAMNEDKAREAAMRQAYLPSIISGLSTATVTALGGKFGPESVVRKEILGLAKNEGYKTAVKGFLQDVAQNAGTEFLEESVDEFVQGVTESLTFNPEKTMGDIMAESMYAGAMGAGFGGAFGALGYVAAKKSNRLAQEAIDKDADLAAKQELLDEVNRITEELESVAPESADAAKILAEETQAKLNREAAEKGLVEPKGEAISIPATVPPRMEGETNEEYRARIEAIRAEAEIEERKQALKEAEIRTDQRQGTEQPIAEKVEGKRIEAAAYIAPDGSVFYGPSHLEAMVKARDAGKIIQEDIEEKQEAVSRETEEFGFSTEEEGFISRDEAEKIARKSDQLLVEETETGKLHSNEVELDAFVEPEIEVEPEVEAEVEAERAAEPTPEGAVAPVEPVVTPEVTEPQPAAEVAPTEPTIAISETAEVVANIDTAIEGVRRLGEVNPLNEKQIVTNGVKVEVERQGQNLNIKDITSTEQGLGRGTEVLRKILSIADENKVPIVVTPQPTGTTTEGQLRRWYSDNGFIDYTQGRMIRPAAEAAPAVTPPAEVTPTPETPNLEPLRRVARAEQAPEDIPSLVEAGLVEVYKDQPVLTEAGLAALPETERPRLTPEARKIQIDTGANEVVAEAISKNLRIGVDQVGTGVRMPAGWTLDGDIYVPPAAPEVRESRREQPVVLKNRFYSQLERTVAAKMPNVSSPEQLKAIIDPTRGSGVKPEEIKWSGITEAIDRIAAENNGRVPKEAIIKYMQDEGRVKFEEVRFENEGVGVTVDTTDWKVGDPIETKNGREWVIRGKISEDSDLYEWKMLADTKDEAIETAKSEAEELLKNLRVRSEGGRPTLYDRWQLAGGENYREVALTMPSKPLSKNEAGKLHYQTFMRKGGDPSWESLSSQVQDDIISNLPSAAFKDPNSYTSDRHFQDVQNYVAHMRLNDRKDSDGKEGLFIEEIQSDRHQEGREKGYDTGERNRRLFEAAKEFYYKIWIPHQRRELPSPEANKAFDELSSRTGFTKAEIQDEGARRQDFTSAYIEEGVPDAPFRKDWPLQMFKRALEEAVASEKEWIGWTVGETQADRYDLSKQISEVAYNVDRKSLFAYDKKGEAVLVQEDVPQDKIAEYIGKEAAQRLINAPKEDSRGGVMQRLKGEGLKVGGEGMAGFYDTILPKEIAKYVKKWGATVEKSKLSDPDEAMTYEGLAAEGLTMREFNALPRDRAEALRKKYTTGTPIWRVNITPEMRRIIEEEGQALFSLQMPSRITGMETEAVATKVESLGFGRGGIVSVVNEPDATFEGRTIIRDGKVVGIELNAAALKDDATIERVLNHEIAESANADGALNTLVAGLTPKERKEINDAITRLGYAEKSRTAEEAARAVELLAEGWKGRKWFEKAVARVEAWANKLGYKLTRRAAEYIAARNVSEINDSFKQAYNKFITPSSQEGAVIRESIREDIIPDLDINEEGSNAETEAVVARRAEAKKAQELVSGTSIIVDEIPAQLREETQANYQNGMTLEDFLNPESFNIDAVNKPLAVANWLEVNGGLMPTVKVEGKEIAKPEKGTSEAEALRLLRRASDILDSKSEATGGKELTYSLQDITATWMESGLGPAALKNAIVQYTNLDVAQAEKTANDFANVYQLAQNATDSKERARVRMDRALPAETNRQKREKERMIKLEEATGSIDSIAEAIRISYDIGVKKPKTDKATEKKQIEEQLRQAKQILRDVVPKEYLGDQLTTLQGATGIEGLKKVVEAAQNGLNEARLDEAVAGTNKAFDRAQKAVKANNIGPEAMAVLRDFVETYSKKGIGPETRAKIEDAISRYQADPVGALEDLATEKYLKQKGALGAIKIDKSLGLDALKEISRIINTTLHADKVARGEMLFNKKQTRQEVIAGISEEIDKIKSISKARKDGGQGIGLFNKYALYKGARVENILRAFGLNKLSEFVYDNLTLDTYQDELRTRRDLKKKIESEIKGITGLDIGTKAYDLYSKETIELTGVDSSGRSKPIKVRRYELLDILASLRDPSNLRRAVNSGGYVIDRLDLAEVDTVKITPETYQEILNKATDQDNQMVDMMVGLYNNDLFQVLENASVQAYGHGIKAVSGTYYPRTADKWTRATEVKKDLDYIAYYQRRVDDVGYLKERDERSKSKLRAVDFLERLDYHVTNDARIGAYLPIVRDIEMVLGDPAIARPLASKIGEDGLNMIREMVRQQTTPPAGLPAGILSTLVGNAGVGVLGFKLHAAMQNPVGIPIATAYYGKDGYKYLAKAFPAGLKALKPSDAKEMSAVLSKYSPYYNERYGDGGFIQEFTSGLSNAPSNRKWRRNLETAAMSWLEGTDRWGAHVRYQLAQQVIKDRTTLKEGTEDFNQAVAREWTKMMFRSENTAHGGDRTGAFQFAGKHPVFKTFIMFQSAVSKQYSLFAEAMLKAQQGGKENLRDAAYQMTFLSASLAASKAISNAFYGLLFPPEDDEEQTWSQLLGKVAGTPLSIVPVVGNFLQNSIETIISPENMRKPMQLDLVSSFMFAMYDAGILASRALNELSEEKIDEVTGDPKFWNTTYKMIKKAAGIAGIAYGKPLAGVFQTGELGFKLKERMTEVFNDEPKTEDFQKKVKEYEKEQRSEPVTQEYAKLFFAVADDNQKQFNRALKDLKAKRPDIKRQDLINAIRRRPEFRVVGMVRSGKLKQRDLEANGISRDYYLTQKALLRSMEEAAKTMYRDSKD
jgi:hypothetical protein